MARDAAPTPNHGTVVGPVPTQGGRETGTSPLGSLLEESMGMDSKRGFEKEDRKRDPKKRSQKEIRKGSPKRRRFDPWKGGETHHPPWGDSYGTSPNMLWGKSKPPPAS